MTLIHLHLHHRDCKQAHFETNKQLLSLQAFQAELDDKDGAGRASRAGLMYRLREKDEALLEQAKKFAQEQKNAERAKLSMHGLRAQLRSATDTIDGASGTKIEGVWVLPCLVTKHSTLQS